MVIKPVRGILDAVSAAAAVSGGTWGNAQQVPGLAALSHGGTCDLRAVSCGVAGYCGAAGGYTTGAGQGQALAVTETTRT
jgi:hypothetical protein